MLKNKAIKISAEIIFGGNPSETTCILKKITINFLMPGLKTISWQNSVIPYSILTFCDKPSIIEVAVATVMSRKRKGEKAMREARALIQLKVFMFLNEAQDDIRSVVSKRYIQFLSLAVMMIVCVTPVFADGIFTDMLESLTDFYNELMPVFNVLALILGVVAGIAWQFASNEKGAELGKKWLIRIAISWIIVTVLPYLMINGRKLLGESATGTGVDDLKDIRPGTS